MEHESLTFFTAQMVIAIEELSDKFDRQEAYIFVCLLTSILHQITCSYSHTDYCDFYHLGSKSYLHKELLAKARRIYMHGEIAAILKTFHPLILIGEFKGFLVNEGSFDLLIHKNGKVEIKNIVLA